MHSLFHSLIFIRAVLSTAVPDISLRGPPEPGDQRNVEHLRLTRRDVPKYIAVAADQNKDDQTKKTREFLDSKVADKTIIITMKDGDHIQAWGQLALTDDAKAEVEKYFGVKKTLYNDGLHKTGVMVTPKKSRSQALETRDVSDQEHAPSSKRAESWTKQTNAGDDLVIVSTPKDTDYLKLKDFVHTQKAGEGIFIYIVDDGVAIDVENVDKVPEFKTDKRTALMTEAATKANRDKYTDDHTTSHGTMVASKAAGQKYGVAKGAAIISVKLQNAQSDMIEALKVIEKHIEENKRGMKSIVVIPLAGQQGWNHDEAVEDDNKNNQLMTKAMRGILNMGTPIIFGAGNDGDKEGAEEIDQLLMVFEDKDTPIINVGAAMYSSYKAKWSQGGPQVTIYAPGGESVEAQTKEKGISDWRIGTSYAAPMVAGVIATYMAYDQPPWDPSKTGKARVQAIKDYIRTDESSWKRPGKGERLIWNGATEEIRNSVGAKMCKRDDCSDTPPPPEQSSPAQPPSPPADQEKKCYQDVTTTKFVDRDMVLKLIDESFCPDAQKQGKLDDNSGSISRTYNMDTPEQIELAADAKPGDDMTSDLEKCKDVMHELVDSCDTTNNKWKRGGERQVGYVKFRVSPQKDRWRDIDNAKPWGGCEFTNKAVYYQYWVWGSGFLGSDKGEQLKSALDGDGGISGSDFDFSYGGGDDHREWTMKFRGIAIVKSQDKVKDHMEDIGGIDANCVQK